MHGVPRVLLVLITAHLAGLASVSQAQIVTGSDGSDGAFVFVQDTGPGAQANTMTIDLALAASGIDGQGQPITWQTPSPVAGRGVYDPFAWAVVFKYSAIVVPAGKTVVFAPHPSRAPVVWLTQGTCSIAGVVSLDGGGANYDFAEPGPGGFRGGAATATQSSHGFGPGGGTPGGASSSAVYGSPICFPLLGGSGSGSGDSCGGQTEFSAGGGGAILIAADASIELAANSGLYARGGVINCGSVNPSGSGGTIRLVSDLIVKSNLATLDADSAPPGRIRLEANTLQGLVTGIPAPTFGPPSQLMPDASTPAVRVVSITVAGQPFGVPVDPRSSTSLTSVDAVVPDTGPATVLIEARNVVPGRTCSLRVLRIPGAATTYSSTPLVGTQALSTATATITLPAALYAVQVRVVL